MAWTNSNNVRLLTGLTENEVSTDDLSCLIDIAQKEVLLQVNTRVIREKVEYIDETRENKIDGINTTFYVKNWRGKFISDDNFDLSVDISDITVYSVDTSGVETELTVSSISYNSGKFILSTAPSNVSIYITYSYSLIDTVSPNPLLKLASEYLTGAYAYMRIDSSQKKSVRFGNVSIVNGVGKESAYSFLYNKYMDIIKQLNESTIGGAIWGISNVLI